MTTEEKLIKNKLGLLKLAEELGNVSQACRVMGYSRDSFYRFRELYSEHGSEGLREISRSKPNPKNRVAPEIENAVVSLATDNPAYGQKRVSNELKKRGIFISPGGVRSIWLRHDLETFKKRIKALEAIRAANDSLILTEANSNRLNGLKKSVKLRVRLRQNIPVISVRRTPTTSEQSKASDVFTSKLSLTPTAVWHSPSSIPPKLP